MTYIKPNIISFILCYVFNSTFLLFWSNNIYIHPDYYSELSNNKIAYWKFMLNISKTIKKRKRLGKLKHTISMFCSTYRKRFYNL